MDPKTLEWIAQAIGIVAMAMNILSYQQKKQSGVIAVQLVGASLFAIHFWMLGAVVGSLLGKMQFGMGIGMLIGLLVGTCIHKKPKE